MASEPDKTADDQDDEQEAVDPATLSGEQAKAIVAEAAARLHADDLPVTRRTLMLAVAGGLASGAFAAGYGTGTARAAVSGNSEAGQFVTQQLILDARSTAPSPPTGTTAVWADDTV